MDMGNKKVYELAIEIGHKASLLNKKVSTGYTHKWQLFVRGVHHSKIEHCIEKVIFQLHDSFEKPQRVFHEPPYLVKETGYAGFEIPIQIYFKNRDKPNHVVFIHDLCLLTNKPNENTRVERLKFHHPCKEFEKCLIKSGAQVLTVSSKKERSDSPPAKKQKSSSLIPSKDMSKQQQSPQLQSQTPQPPIASSHHQQKPSQHNSNNHSSNHHSSSKQSHHNHHTQQQQHPQHSQSTTQKPKTSSREFIDIFGNPLAYNIGGPNASNDISTGKETNSTGSVSLINHTSNYNSGSSNHSHNSKHHHSKHHTSKDDTNKEDQYANDLQLIQAKISSLSDCDRLQRIVDIVEEAGEWYNLTPRKFEFDLKRLDKKTLSKIERCLH